MSAGDAAPRVPSEDELARTMQVRFPTAFAQAKTFVDDPRMTIEPPPAMSDSAGKHALEDLGTPSVARRLTAGLDVGETIGEGGMGLVRVATQRALGRSVVVKTLRPEATADPSAAIRLLREAWVTGQVEHPNIVPVYDLGVDDAGLPVIVLKRIEGLPWSALVHDGAAILERFGATDPLEWNLRILLQVANAIDLAHSRGVLHRDVKPENVMIGAFGEVYLVDWGIAVSLRDDPTGRLPLAKHAKEMAGTPCYMAPEMLGGAPERLGPRTDVYLLGATLFELSCGSAPHHGANLQAMLHRILLSEPTFPDGVPDELASICRRAMARDPDDRHASVAELRTEIEGFLHHRGSAQIAADARVRHDELTRVLAALPEKPLDARARLYDLFGECRFGYRQALRSWPENEAAVEGLRAAAEAMIAFELEHGSADAAVAILAELPSPPADLARRVERAAAARRREDKRMREAAQQADPTIGWRTRAFAALVFGAIWTGVPLAIAITGMKVGYQEMFVATAALPLLGGAFNLWARDTLRRSAVTRVQGRVPFVVFTAQGFLLVAAMLLGLDAHRAFVLCIALWGLGAGMTALVLDLRLAPIGVGYGAALLVAAAKPELAWWAAAASNALAGSTTAVVWGRLGREAEAKAASPESTA